MKNFFKHLIEWKMSACAVFTAAIFIYLSFCLVYDIREVSTGVLWGLFWVSAASSLIQAVCFSEWIIKKLRYTWRSLLFVRCCRSLPGRLIGSLPVKRERGLCSSVFSSLFSR